MSSSAQIRQVTASAPGKVILHGEYAVVFGKKAIAVSVDLRTTVNVTITGNGEKVKLFLKDLSSSQSWPLDTLKSASFSGPDGDSPPELQADLLSSITPHGLAPAVDQAIRAFLYLYLGLSHKSNEWIAIDVTVQSQFPSGAGLGSSAAFSVSLTAALAKAISGVIPEKQVISDWAFRCEHIFHGKPSGIDNSICTFGGAILFQAGQVVDEIHDLKKLPALLVYTNVTRNTKLLVESVTRRRERFPSVVASIMSAIDEISAESWTLIRTGKYDGSDNKELVTMNQRLLTALGAGHGSIDQVLAIGSGRGYAGKLTGAGGGGCVIIHLPADLPEKEISELKNELSANNFPHWLLSFGGTGVTFESE